jgi:glycosyltransferase involved in cell wall biosynthesis
LKCPTLSELPPVSGGRSGWPWTEESPRVGQDAAEGDWPSISVIIPSFQQAPFLEETLRSVLLQGYPALELFVIDGGSTDGTLEVIRRYEPWISKWVSGPDGGQSAAINKGWRESRGDLVTWLNSDDLLLPGWAGRAAEAFNADASLDFVYGDVQVIDGESRPQWIYRAFPATVERIVVYWKTPFAQQGFLMRRRVLDECGYLDESLHFTMDVEYWLRLLVARRKFRQFNETVAAYRLHATSKTSAQNEKFVPDMLDVSTRFCRTAPPELSGLAARAQTRLYWNAAHSEYGGRRHAGARRYALRYLREGGWKALPRVGGMFALSMLGQPGHRFLDLTRRLRAPNAG